MNISFPTTTPAIGIAGIYFNFSNATSPPATTTAATRGTPFAPETLPTVPTSRGAALSPAPAIVAPSTGIPVAGGTPAAGTSTLTITTNPAGALLFIDNVLRGAGMASVPGLPAGSHMLQLEKSGSRVMRVPVDICDGKTTDYSTALVPESSGGTDMLPLIIGAGVLLIRAGAALYLQREKAP